MGDAPARLTWVGNFVQVSSMRGSGLLHVCLWRHELE